MWRSVVLLALAACTAPAPPRAASGGGEELPPAPVPPSLAALIGDFAAGPDTLSVLERDGALHLLPWGGSPIELERLADTLWLAGPADTVPLPARPEAPLVWRGRSFAPLAHRLEEGAVFRIVPLRPAGELLAEALTASPPDEAGDFLDADLVELVTLDPSIRLDIRYATTDNFLGAVVYSQARAFLQRPAAEALVRAHRSLAERGYGLLVHDAYRPWYVTKAFWDATPEPLREFVADPARGSRHNRGCAVDLTLFELATGRAVEMPSGYDEFSPRARSDYPGGTSRQRWYRALLRQAMEAEGFIVNPAEWWHFDYRDWRRYRLANLRFEDLG